jgi:hypothetical protein
VGPVFIDDGILHNCVAAGPWFQGYQEQMVFDPFKEVLIMFRCDFFGPIGSCIIQSVQAGKDNPEGIL